MLIAIDYDETYTADPFFWDSVLIGAGLHSHKVVCISARCNTPENMKEIRTALVDWPGVPVYLCHDTPKRQYAEEHGLSVDVWIDDTPEGIGGGDALDRRKEQVGWTGYK